MQEVHTRRQVAATRFGDMSQRQIIALCAMANFCQNCCLCKIILSLQQD